MWPLCVAGLADIIHFAQLMERQVTTMFMRPFAY